MMELRQKIADIIREAHMTRDRQFAYTGFADRILAIPEIAEALHSARARAEIDANWHENRRRCDEAARRLPDPPLEQHGDT